ncbi:MAG: MBL fold metallo-hydrolase [Desulfobacterales bacterium]|nr:MBL fold metallo-hydrolase [Desulfobacterales bacterium]
MHVTFYGAVREVTGSMHLITTETDRILLDCGMFQGRRKETEQKNRVLPFDPQIITNVVLSHAHIDHSGRIPLLTKDGFNGNIICTRATVDACEYLLDDSAHIQESDANYLNYKTVRSYLYGLMTSSDKKKKSNRDNEKIRKILKSHRNTLNTEKINEYIKNYHMEDVCPLYTVSEAQQSFKYFNGYPYRQPVTIGKDTTCTFYDAGHILGSAFSIIKTIENGRSYTVCYTGDIGRFDTPILKNPTMNFHEEDRNIDLLIMESTYGNRLHEPVKDLKQQLKQVLINTFNRGGSVLIPSFAYGRAQEIVYFLHELYNEGEVPRRPVYVDSPLATKLTGVYGEHPEAYNMETNKVFLKDGKNPFMFDQIRFVGSVDESMDLMRDEKQHIVIAASGMCEAGRILHHLRYKIHNAKNTVLIIGYMAKNTLGRRIHESGELYEKSGRKGPPPQLKFLNKIYPLKAHVTRLGGFSAHADKSEMLRFVKESNLRIKKIAVVHGEEDQSILFANQLEDEGFSVVVPKVGEMVRIK